MSKRLVTFGYKESIVKTCKDKNIDVITLIDDYEDKDFLPPIDTNEIRLETRNNANDFFTVSALIENGIENIDGVIAPFEFTLFNASVLANTFNCCVVPVMSALNFRDKIVQKRKLKSFVNMPNVWSKGELQYINPNDFPLIVKPSDGTGTALTTKVCNRKELEDAINKIKVNGSEFNSFIVEECIYGDEFYVDGWISNGEIQLFTISRYVENLINIQNGAITQGINLVYEENESLYKEVEKLLRIVFIKLELKNSAFHLEFFRTNDNEIVFGECAARLGGVMPETVFSYHFGVDILSTWIDICLGKYTNVVTNSKVIKEHTGFTLIPSPSNVASENVILPTLKEFQEKFNFVISVVYKWVRGQSLPDNSASTGYRIGDLFVKGKSDKEVKQNLDSAIKFFLEVNRG